MANQGPAPPQRVGARSVFRACQRRFVQLISVIPVARKRVDTRSGACVQRPRKELEARVPVERRIFRISLYERIGGQAVLEAFVDRFYEVMAGDPEVVRIWRWHAPDLTELKHKLVAFLSGFAGGPPLYPAALRAAVHARPASEVPHRR